MQAERGRERSWSCWLVTRQYNRLLLEDRNTKTQEYTTSLNGAPVASCVERGFLNRNQENHRHINSPLYSMPHFSFTITGFPVSSFKKGFGFTGVAIVQCCRCAALPPPLYPASIANRNCKIDSSVIYPYLSEKQRIFAVTRNRYLSFQWSSCATAGGRICASVYWRQLGG